MDIYAKVKYDRPYPLLPIMNEAFSQKKDPETIRFQGVCRFGRLPQAKRGFSALYGGKAEIKPPRAIFQTHPIWYTNTFLANVSQIYSLPF